MAPSLLLSVVLLTSPVSPGTRLMYEQRCLYCHSEEVSESKHLSARQWQQTVEAMRLKAPLLITRSDARAIYRYIVQTLKLTAPPPPTSPRVPTSRPSQVETPALTAPPMPPPPPAPELKGLPPRPADAPPTLPDALDEPRLTEADELAEREGAELLQRRCSKCHTLTRVFGKLDSLERSLSTLRRMRLKTGSGISADDARVIETYLRLDLAQAQ